MSRPDTVHELKARQMTYGYDWKTGDYLKNILTFEDLSMNLPLAASIAGMTLAYELPPITGDPIYLRDRDGNILHEWDYVPSLTEVREVAMRYL